ncbi:hypothetical protein B6V72_17270 [Thioclava sp. F34-6]|nr:hypothetical protein B6V72_17270 [Thioclava sp. F34-6]
MFLKRGFFSGRMLGEQTFLNQEHPFERPASQSAKHWGAQVRANAERGVVGSDHARARTEETGRAVEAASHCGVERQRDPERGAGFFAA